MSLEADCGSSRARVTESWSLPIESLKSACSSLSFSMSCLACSKDTTLSTGSVEFWKICRMLEFNYTEQICYQWTTKQHVNLSTVINIFSSKFYVEHDLFNTNYYEWLLANILIFFLCIILIFPFIKKNHGLLKLNHTLLKRSHDYSSMSIQQP